MSEPAPRYRFGPRSTRGLVAGWRPGQIVWVAIGCLTGLGLLRAIGGALGVLVGVVLVGLALAGATWPVAGRTVEQWLPTAARFGSRAVTDRAAPQPVSGSLRPWGPGRARGGPLSRLRLTAEEETGSGAVVDDRAGTWTGVMTVGGSGFALLDEDARADRLAAWAGVLAAAAHEGGGLHRIQWVARTLPAYLIGTPPELPPAPPDRGDAARAYGDLLADIGPELWAREAMVAVSVRGRRGRPRRDAATSAKLGHQLRFVRDGIRAAGLSCGPPLSVGQLARCLRRSIDTMPADDPVSWPWPLGVAEEWSRLRTDDSWHVTYWIAEWPRHDVSAGWLLPLVVAGGIRHTVSLTMAPLGPMSATRRAERERTSGSADAELRRRHGFAMTARARREQEARIAREAELADGHAGYLFSGYVTVTDEDAAGLERSCTQLEQAASLSQVEIRRLYGSQEAGFCCGLPIGRGCEVR